MPSARCVQATLSVVLWIAFMVPSAAAQVAQSGGRVYALLVGVQTYVNHGQLRNLSYAEDDVEEFASLLQKAGADPKDLVVMTNSRGSKDPRYIPIKANIRKELDACLRFPKAGDTVILAFSGHGVQFKGDNDEFYFCPTDADLEKKDNLISLTAVYKELQGCQARLRVLFSDCCRNDPVQQLGKSADQVESVTAPQRREPPGGVAAFFSCSGGEEAIEDHSLKHSVFYHFLLQGLRGKAADARGQVTLPALVGFVSDAVSQYAHRRHNRKQTPELQVGKLIGLPLILNVANLLQQEVSPRDKALDALLKGHRHYDRGEFKQAQELYQSAADLDAKFAAPHYYLGYMLHTGKAGPRDGDQALKQLTLAIQQDANLTAAYAARGAVHLSRREYRGALEDYNRALTYDPNNPSLYRGRYYANLALGDSIRARRDKESWDRLSAPASLRGR